MKSASVVFVTPDNLVGLGLRGRSLESPLTWAAIGGHTEPHESLHQAAHREVWEELGVKIPNRLEYLGNVGENYVFVCRVPDTFQVRLNWENLDFQWKTLSEWQEHKLHPELRQIVRSRRFLAEQEFEAMPEDEFADTEKWLMENYFSAEPKESKRVAGGREIERWKKYKLKEKAYNEGYDYSPPKDFDPRGYAPYGGYETTRDITVKKGVTNFPMNWWFSAQAVEFWETILGIKQALKTTLKQQTRTPNPFEPYDWPKPKKRSPMDYYDQIMRDRSRKMYDDLRKGESE